MSDKCRLVHVTIRAKRRVESEVILVKRGLDSFEDTQFNSAGLSKLRRAFSRRVSCYAAPGHRPQLPSPATKTTGGFFNKN